MLTARKSLKGSLKKNDLHKDSRSAPMGTAWIETSRGYCARNCRRRKSQCPMGTAWIETGRQVAEGRSHWLPIAGAHHGSIQSACVAPGANNQTKGIPLTRYISPIWFGCDGKSCCDGSHPRNVAITSRLSYGMVARYRRPGTSGGKSPASCARGGGSLTSAALGAGLTSRARGTGGLPALDVCQPPGRGVGVGAGCGATVCEIALLVLTRVVSH
jgi:hypothetical protein